MRSADGHCLLRTKGARRPDLAVRRKGPLQTQASSHQSLQQVLVRPERADISLRTQRAPQTRALSFAFLLHPHVLLQKAVKHTCKAGQCTDPTSFLWHTSRKFDHSRDLPLCLTPRLHTIQGLAGVGSQRFLRVKENCFQARNRAVCDLCFGHVMPTHLAKV